MEQRFDWPAFLEIRKRARQSAVTPNLSGGALNARNRPAVSLRRSRPPAATPFRLPFRFWALSALGHHRGECDLEKVALLPTNVETILPRKGKTFATS